MKFTIRSLFIILLFLGLFLMTLRPIADPDFWWHLRTGQMIAQTHTIPNVDPFSFTKNGRIWITHEWLSELLIYGLFRLGGYGLLIFFFSILITGAFLIAYLRSTSETRPYISGFVVLLGAIATAPTWGVRPQMISLLITSLFLFLLDSYRRTANYKFLIPLPFITLLWVNLHAGYLLGLALIGIYVVGIGIELFIARFVKGAETGRLPTLTSALSLSACLIICLLAALVNPNGYKIILYPFQTLVSPSMQQFIQEWFSPDFHQLSWLPFAIFILILIGAGMLSKKSISPTNIMLTLLFSYAALHSMRNIPIFVIIAIPVVSEQIGDFVNVPLEKQVQSRLFPALGIFLIICVTAVVSVRFIQVNESQSKTESDNFPEAAVNWLLQNKPQGNLFNSYGWGGYLIWKTYPEYRVFIDGRADVYGDSFIFDYMTIYRAQQGWQDLLNHQGVNTVLVENNAPLANMLRQSQAWHETFQDKLSAIFVR